ncbi:ATP-binding cassette domain-containing protein, partial [Azoarcus taiwanensis]
MAEPTDDTASIFPLRVRGLGFHAGGRAVLDGVDLDLANDGITMVLGPNGAGKSVLLRLLCGLLTPTAGEIRWADGGRPDGRVTMVFQQPMVLRTTVLDNVALALKPQGVARSERRRRAAGC